MIGSVGMNNVGFKALTYAHTLEGNNFTLDGHTLKDNKTRKTTNIEGKTLTNLNGGTCLTVSNIRNGKINNVYSGTIVAGPNVDNFSVIRIENNGKLYAYPDDKEGMQIHSGSRDIRLRSGQKLLVHGH